MVNVKDFKAVIKFAEQAAAKLGGKLTNKPTSDSGERIHTGIQVGNYTVESTWRANADGTRDLVNLNLNGGSAKAYVRIGAEDVTDPASYAKIAKAGLENSKYYKPTTAAVTSSAIAASVKLTKSE